MRIGVWSLAHLHAYSYIAALSARADVEFVGIADEQEPESGARVAQERGVRFFPSADDLLAAADAVVVTSANADHRAMALRAAERGVSVLLEKPIATTVADAREIVEAFAGGPTLAIAFPTPFSPAFEALQGDVAAGTLGRILAMRTTNRGTMPGGFFIELERSGGGAVIDHTVHVADLLRRLTGAEYERVYAEVGHGLFHETWDDSGLLTLEMTDGAFATLDCSWSRPRSFPTWGDVTLRVIGERGNASADLFGQRIVRYPAAEASPSWEAWGSELDALMIEDFIAAVHEGRRPRSDGTDGLRALEVALAAYRSAQEGRPVPIADLRQGA